jgi:hypothetical protein
MCVCVRVCVCVFVLILSTNFVWKIYYYKKDWAQYFKHLQMSSYKVPVIFIII